MKKITLALLSAIGACSTAFGQANIDVVAPPFNSSTQVRLPNGLAEHKTLRGVMLIRQSELAALTGSVINSVGFIRLDGTGPTTSAGNFTLYLENTTDATYNKGTNWTTAISTMGSPYFAGAFTIPPSTSATTVILSTPGFVYTGGGIYVAWDWEESTPSPNNNNNPATWAANSTGSGNNFCATGSTSLTPATTTLSLTNFRPIVVFNAVNTATNEAGLADLIAPGIVAKMDGGHTIVARVRNSSVGTLANVGVTLAVSGANTFNNVKTITSIAPGAIADVSFDPFIPTANGQNNINVSISSDQNTANNSLTWTQSVTCNEIALRPPGATTLYTSYALGAGASTTGRIYSFKYNYSAGGASLTAVKVIIPSFANAANLGKTIFASLQDASGNLIAQGPNVTITGPMMDVVASFDFTTPIALAANTDYYIGIGMPTNAYFPIGVWDTATPSGTMAGFYSSVGSTGGALTNHPDYGYLSLQGALSFSNTNVTVSATKTLVCKADRAPITVTAVGADSYTWSFAGAGNGPTVAVTPTISASQPSGLVVYNVTGGYTTGVAAGCKSPVASITMSVAACTGLNDLDNVTEINIFPNPATSNEVRVTGLVGNNSIVVFNSIGQTVFSTETAGETAEIDMSGLAAGSYLVRISDDQNRVKTVKLGKQ